MDVLTLDVALFLGATFLAALTAGAAGFAFGLIAAAVWLHVLTPTQTATLIIAFGIIVQGASVWKLRHTLQWTRLAPFLVGAVIGVPIGVAILGWADPSTIRLMVGAVLVAYSAYGLVRPRRRSRREPRATPRYPAKPLVSYQTYRQLSGRILPPLVIRAFRGTPATLGNVPSLGWMLRLVDEAGRSQIGNWKIRNNKL